MVKRIGLLTGGGDCPGLNAVIRTITLCALTNHIEVVGILDGYSGLVENRTRRLSEDDVADILTVGGTILGTSNKSDPRHYISGYDQDGSLVYLDRTEDCIQTVRRNCLDALIVVGGDGTMAGAAHLVEHGIRCIGIPKTIDNDIPATDLTFGFLTAVKIASEALDRVKTTAASHARVMVVEVMGRNSGWIALHSGIASGVDIVLIPEVDFSLDTLAKQVQRRTSGKKRYCIVCVAEGAHPKGTQQIISKYDPTSPDPIRLGGVGKFLAEELEKLTRIESRYVVLGHVQRGGMPEAADRIVATGLAYHAMKLLSEGKFGHIVVFQNGQVGSVDLQSIAGQQRKVPINHPLVECAKTIGIGFGDE